jgi:membrane-associated phospholipid phosphatase
VTGDRHDFNVVKDFANSTSWLHGFMSFMAKDGIVLFAVTLLAGWWIGRRENSPRKVALAVWAAVAAVVALVLVQPIADAAKEKRPFVGHPEVHKLIKHAADFGFPSDHATGAGAIAVGLLFLSWRLGLLTTLLALLIAFSRVYVGVHFPQDVGAGLALGAVVAVIGVILVVPLLARLIAWLAGTPIRPLVAASPAEQPL